MRTLPLVAGAIFVVIVLPSDISGSKYFSQKKIPIQLDSIWLKFDLSEKMGREPQGSG